MEMIVKKGVERLRFKEFLQKNLEEYQDLVCAYQNLSKGLKDQKKLKYYQTELEYYKRAYFRFNLKSQSEFENDVIEAFKVKGTKKDLMMNSLSQKITTSWNSYKKNRKGRFDDIFYFSQTQSLFH